MERLRFGIVVYDNKLSFQFEAAMRQLHRTLFDDVFAVRAYTDSNGGYGPIHDPIHYLSKGDIYAEEEDWTHPELPELSHSTSRFFHNLFTHSLDHISKLTEMCEYDNGRKFLFRRPRHSMQLQTLMSDGIEKAYVNNEIEAYLEHREHMTRQMLVYEPTLHKLYAYPIYTYDEPLMGAQQNANGI